MILTPLIYLTFCKKVMPIRTNDDECHIKQESLISSELPRPCLIDGMTLIGSG